MPKFYVIKNKRTGGSIVSQYDGRKIIEMKRRFLRKFNIFGPYPSREKALLEEVLK